MIISVASSVHSSRRATRGDEQSRGRLVQASGNLQFSPQGTFHFDKRSGRPLWPGCINGCELAVSSGQESARLRIEPEGYIHAIP